MTSQAEFAAFLQADPEAGYQNPEANKNKNDDNKDTPEWMQSWAKQGQQPPGYGSTSAGGPKLPQAPRRSPNSGEYSPLLPPASPNKPTPKQPMNPARPRSHGRSRSDFVFASQDPSHPLMGAAPKPGGLPPKQHQRSSSRGNKPPRITTTIATTGVLASPGASSFGMPLPPPSPSNAAASARGSHRRAKSEIPSSHSGGFGTQRLVTKNDLLKNFPDPRWGGKPLNISHHNRRRTGSGGAILEEGSVHSKDGSMVGGDNPLLSLVGGLSGGGGYGTIGSVVLDVNAKKSKGHARTMSDASMASVTTDMAKSALFKGVTEHGTIQLQLPKDSFRVLMDSSLEAGCVYKRKLVDEEDQFFVEFHTVDENISNPSNNFQSNTACHCTCDRCNRCQEKQKRLPPDLYVMAVDATLYRRILDEVMDSQSMPCGTYFCGHHEDVRHPDITIAAIIVSIVFIGLFVATVTIKG